MPTGFPGSRLGGRLICVLPFFAALGFRHPPESDMQTFLHEKLTKIFGVVGDTILAVIVTVNEKIGGTTLLSSWWSS